MSNPNQFFPQSGGGFPQQGGGFYGPPPKKSGGSSIWIVLGVIGLGCALLGVACCGGILYVARPPVASAAAKQPFKFADVPLPPFPAERGEPDEIEPGVPQYVINILDDEGGFYDKPGHGGFLYLYLPPGEHPAKSLPCILVAPAGSTLLAGMDLGEGDQPEHAPYVKAGCAVLAYELDGPDYDGDLDERRDAYKAFRDARAGLVNARNALEYVLAKVPEVDPARIYAAGHSSAATHALLFAAHEPRLAGVLAYAPAPDLPKRMGPQLPVFRILMPGVVDFVTQSSPSTQMANIKCPTFLFHAQDDSNCPIADTTDFAEQLKRQGTDVKFVTVPSGDHYDSMINEGIPAGIQWLKDRQAIK